MKKRVGVTADVGVSGAQRLDLTGKPKKEQNGGRFTTNRLESVARILQVMPRRSHAARSSTDIRVPPRFVCESTLGNRLAKLQPAAICAENVPVAERGFAASVNVTAVL